jgi:hypothetical protein
MSPDDISDTLDDWYGGEMTRDEVVRDALVARGQRLRKLCEGRTLEALAREIIGDAIGEDCSDLSSGDVVQLAELLSDHLAALALLEPAPQPYKCRLCEDTRWVCEQHPDRPWSGMNLTPSACPDGCAGPGVACPLCHPAAVPQDGTLRERIADWRDQLSVRWGRRHTLSADEMVNLRETLEDVLALLAAAPEPREPDGWVSAATAVDLQHMTATLVERIIWKHCSPDHDRPVYIGAPERREP